MVTSTTQSTGRSTNSSSSSSTPVVVQTPQSQWGLQLSQLLSNIGQGQYQWAQGQFNNAQSVTDQQINNYLTDANKSLAQSDSLWNQYNNTFAPVMNQVAQQAETWASPARQNFNAGQAESTAGQAADLAANNAKNQLMSFGVNPSSGMYGELEDAQQAARAASQASAGTQASLQTQEQGNQMLTTAAQLGQQLPGQSVNAMNAAYQGVSGAENSILGLENTGVNLMDSANPYFSSAANAIKMPAVGQNSQSQSFGTSTNQSQGQSQGGSGSGSGNAPSQSNPWQTGSGDNSNAGFGAQPGDFSTGGAGGGGGGGGGGQPSAGILSVPGSDSGSNGGTWDTFGTGGGYGGVGGADATGTTDMSSFVDPSLSTSDFGNYSTPDTSSFASGGVIPTTGGHVPPSASPSHGAQTDDIPARLNADEYVIPRDVVHWKGKEFFEKLIQQSRKARGAPPQPIGAQMKPPLAGRPTFRSRPMTAGAM